jgi:hypothetical protein
MSAEDDKKKKARSHRVPLWETAGLEGPVDPDTAIREMLEFRKGKSLGDMTAVQLIRMMRDGRYNE